MKNRLSNINILAIVVFLTQIPALTQTPQEIFERTRPAICLVKYYRNIATDAKIGSYIKQKQYRIGILVNPEGLVMVSSGVYPLSLDFITGTGGSFFSGEPTDFKVKLYDGRTFAASFIGKDDLAQVAFLQIKENLPDSLPFIKFSSSGQITIGQQIYLIELLGETYEFTPLFTPLTINAIITTPRKKFLVKNLSPALSPGGLVLDNRGRAIGISLRTQLNFNFGVQTDFEELRKEYLEIAPSEWFMSLIDNPPVLKKAVFRGKAWLGIRMQALTPGLRDFWKIPATGGIVIDRIFPDSPADQARLKIQDVITAIDGKPLKIDRDEELDRFREHIIHHPPESEVEITVFRNGKIFTKKVRLKAAPPAIDLADKYEMPELGLEVREITRDILYNNNLPLSTEGVYVYRVDRASPAGLGGLRLGQIITRVNNQPVKDLATFKNLMEKINHSSMKKIWFRVLDRRETAFIFVDKK